MLTNVECNMHYGTRFNQNHSGGGMIGEIGAWYINGKSLISMVSANATCIAVVEECKVGEHVMHMYTVV